MRATRGAYVSWNHERRRPLKLACGRGDRSIHDCLAMACACCQITVSAARGATVVVAVAAVIEEEAKLSSPSSSVSGDDGGRAADDNAADI